MIRGVNPEPRGNKIEPGISIRMEIQPNCWICEKEIKEGESFFGSWENGIIYIDSHRTCQEKEKNKPENERKMCWMDCP